MSEYKIYHNPRCSKCRATLEILEETDGHIEIIEYLKNPPTAQELDDVLVLLGMEPEQVVRKNEDRYTELRLEQNPPSSRLAWIEVLIKNPILIERPIVTDGKRAVIGRPPENVKKLFE